jgi:quercetin dioxygenase-like cupin family protein
MDSLLRIHAKEDGYSIRSCPIRREHTIPNIDGKSMVALVVTYPPGGKSPAHHHARSAFIYAYVLSDAIRSQVGDEPVKVYQVGEGFYEMPGSHHRSVRMRVTVTLRAYWLSSWSIPKTIP